MCVLNFQIKEREKRGSREGDRRVRVERECVNCEGKREGGQLPKKEREGNKRKKIKRIKKREKEE